MAKKGKGDNNDKRKRKRERRTLAQRADKYTLYQRAVQAPDVEVKFFTKAFKRAHGRRPKVLREDFCGTAAVACEWVASKRTRVAYGVDLDPEPLAWGRENNASKLKNGQLERLHMLQGDVRNTETPPADVLAAQNFSFFIFKERRSVTEYFRTAYENLADEGVMVLDMFGGSEVWQDDHKEERQYKKFNYIWDQHRVDPISHDATFYIHFYFPKDRSRLDHAFTYEWRMWTIPEVREMLADAGFAESIVYWEGTDDDGEGNGIYKPKRRAPADPAWIAYLVAVKRPAT